jgi:hypothetical protein
MAAKIHSLPDGTSIEWVDKETLRYADASRSALIWVDFAPGLFSRKRVIHSSSIDNWEASGASIDAPERISDDDRVKILEAISTYYRERGVGFEIKN